MLLTMARPGEENRIRKITGKDETRRFLANLGFVEGEKVVVVSELTGDLILNIRNTRIALNKGVANRIVV